MAGIEPYNGLDIRDIEFGFYPHSLLRRTVIQRPNNDLYLTVAKFYRHREKIGRIIENLAYGLHGVSPVGYEFELAYTSRLLTSILALVL
jgi:hypothetical protein